MTGMEATTDVRKMAKSERHTLIFLHILKTGGITLGSLLARHYKEEERFAAFPFKALPEGRIETLKALPPRQKEKIRFLYGHLGFGYHEEFTGPASYIALLREPVGRVISRYYHEQREPKSHLHAKIRAGMSLVDYVHYMAEVARMDNLQTRMIAGNWQYRGQGPCTASMLEDARRNLRTRFLLVGLTERFDESYLMLCRQLGWKPLFYRRLNVARRRPRQEDLPAETVAVIREHNRYDIELYQFAQELFAEQVGLQGKSFPIQVQWFRFWNGLYAPYKRVRSFSLRHYLWDGASVATTAQEE